MPLDYATLDLLRQENPAWRLLRAQHTPLVAAFLHRVFVVPGLRDLPQAELVGALEDELAALRIQHGPDAFPGSAQDYLNDWAADGKGWLRKFYPPDSDEPHFDLTPASEKALLWLEGLNERRFVGTESRLLVLFDLLRQICEGSQADPKLRVAALHRRRDDIDSHISRILSGDAPLLDEARIRDRFQQFVQLARELLADFREVDSNFRTLDREARERITRWAGNKGALLDQILNERDAIAASDQGKSFQAFWQFLMSPARQEELGLLLEQALSLPAVQNMHPDPRLLRIHYDWLEAGEHTQRTVARLSGQLRKFLDDQAWLENRRIMDILHNIKNQALILRDCAPRQNFMSIADTSPQVELPLERPLYRETAKAALSGEAVDGGNADLDLSALYAQSAVNREELAANIKQEIQTHGQISLADVINRHPLRHGLAELLCYLYVAGEWTNKVVDSEVRENIVWQSEPGIMRRTSLPRILLLGE